MTAKAPLIPDQATLSADAAVALERGRIPFTTQALNVGCCLVPNLDNIAEVLEYAEGPFYR